MDRWNEGRPLLVKAWFIFIMVSSACTLIFILYKGVNISGYKKLYLIPLFYGLLSVLFPAVYKYLPGHAALWVFNIVMYVRYVVMPLLLTASSYFTGFGSNPIYGSVNLALYLILYEMISVFVIVSLFARRFYKDGHDLGPDKTKDSAQPKLLLSIFILAGLLLVIRDPSTINTSNLFIISKEVEYTTQSAEFQGLVNLIIYWMRLFLLLILLDWCRRKYEAAGKKIYYFISCLFLLAFIASFTGTSRWNIVVPTICGIVVLMRFFPGYRKATILTFAAICSISIVSITLYKFFDITLGSGVTNLRISGSWWANMLQMYFAGPRNVALAIETKKCFPFLISMQTLINDFTGSIPYISHFVNQMDRSNAYFNFRIFGIGDNMTQIIPLAGQGYLYFGALGAPLFTSLAVVLMMWIDGKTIRENRVFNLFILTHGAVWLSLCMMFNTEIIWGGLINKFILPLAILYFNERIYVKSHNTFKLKGDLNILK